MLYGEAVFCLRVILPELTEALLLAVIRTHIEKQESPQAYGRDSSRP